MTMKNNNNNNNCLEFLQNIYNLISELPELDETEFENLTEGEWDRALKNDKEITDIVNLIDDKIQELKIKNEQ